MLSSPGLPAGDHPVRRKRRGGLTAGIVAIVSVVAAAAVLPATLSAGAGRNNDSRKLQDAVTLDGLLAQTRALQQIADANDGFRAAGTTGHSASAGYVFGQLSAAGYNVTLQPFEFPYFQESAPLVFEQTAPTPTVYSAEEAVTMTYSAGGDVTGTLQAVDLVLPPTPDPSSTSGCEPADFAGFTPGNVALMQRGTCGFLVKAQNAEAAGAVGAVIFNEGNANFPDRQELLNGTLGTPDVGIPVVGTTFALGSQLNSTPDTEVHITVTAIADVRTTFNVIAETKGGRADNVVMLGAHLDSVPAGPGINDNASGSAALLEIAEGLATSIKRPVNKVRFAWWSAEEFNLLGSEHYVANLTPSQLGDIALYLNFDMIASPNFGRFVYDGDDSDATGAGAGPDGSAAIETVFTDYFASKDLPTEGTDFDGRSDYGPFIAQGIPSGGLFTGAEDIKTPEQAAKFGGTAGVAFDACYHQACDNTRNLSNKAFIQNADAAAHATATFAADTSSVNDRTRRADVMRTAAVAAGAVAGLAGDTAQ